MKKQSRHSKLFEYEREKFKILKESKDATEYEQKIRELTKRLGI